MRTSRRHCKHQRDTILLSNDQYELICPHWFVYKRPYVVADVNDLVRRNQVQNLGMILATFLQLVAVSTAV